MAKWRLAGLLVLALLAGAWGDAERLRWVAEAETKHEKGVGPGCEDGLSQLATCCS